MINSKVLKGSLPGQIYCIYPKLVTGDLLVTVKESLDYGVTWKDYDFVTVALAANPEGIFHIDAMIGNRRANGLTTAAIYFIVSSNHSGVNDDLYLGWLNIGEVDIGEVTIIQNLSVAGKTPSLFVSDINVIQYVYENDTASVSRIYKRTATFSESANTVTNSATVTIDTGTSTIVFTNPKLAGDTNGNYAIVYHKHTAPLVLSNYMSALFVSSSNGTTWTAPAGLTQPFAVSCYHDTVLTKIAPSIFFDINNYLHIMFTYFVEQSSEVNAYLFPYKSAVARYCKSYDNGATFLYENLYSNTDYIFLTYDIKQNNDGEMVISTSTVSQSKTVLE